MGALNYTYLKVRVRRKIELLLEIYSSYQETEIVTLVTKDKRLVIIKNNRAIYTQNTIYRNWKVPGANKLQLHA